MRAFIVQHFVACTHTHEKARRPLVRPPTHKRSHLHTKLRAAASAICSFLVFCFICCNSVFATHCVGRQHAHMSK